MDSSIRFNAPQCVGRGLIKDDECLLKLQLWGASRLFVRSNSDALCHLLGEASLFCNLVRQPETTSSCTSESLLLVAVAETAVAVAKLALDNNRPLYGTDGRSISAQQAQ